MKQALTAEQEAQAQQLATDLAQMTQSELLEMARTLVATTDATLFGETEFEVRTIVHRIAAKAYQQHIGQKKVTKGPA